MQAGAKAFGTGCEFCAHSNEESLPVGRTTQKTGQDGPPELDRVQMGAGSGEI